ncbi:MAG: ornithine cyclodeaminase family protein [Chloroflexi bacterium]|nr:ornithine cyclodeaminase family protein [Chloroflexota bacterium]
MTLLLREEDVRAVLSMEACLAAVEEAFRQRAGGQAVVRQRTRMPMPGGLQTVMGGWVGGPINAYGLKVYGGPRKPGVPATGMVVLLYDGEAGRLLAVVTADRLGQMRTGAASGVATKYMARLDATTVGIIGTGYQAETQLEAVCRVRPIRQVWAYSRTPEKREGFAQRMAQQLAIPVTAVPSAEAAVREADIVVTITSSRQPVMEGAWLAEGTHINAAGTNHYLRQEVDGEAIRRAALVVVDDLPQARAECGELMAAVERGALLWEQVHELADVVVGRVPGRPDARAITLFESQGIGIEDVAAARVIYEAARGRGLGQEVPL